MDDSSSGLISAGSTSASQLTPASTPPPATSYLESLGVDSLKSTLKDHLPSQIVDSLFTAGVDGAVLFSLKDSEEFLKRHQISSGMWKLLKSVIGKLKKGPIGTTRKDFEFLNECHLAAFASSNRETISAPCSTRVEQISSKLALLTPSIAVICDGETVKPYSVSSGVAALRQILHCKGTFE